MANREAGGDAAAAAATAANKDDGPRTFKFPSHQSHMVSLAKMCQENKEYTDCVIQCGGVIAKDDQDGEDVHKLRAHRLVLGAVSPFLKLVFSEVPATLPEATILVPGVKQRVVKALLDFLYTGEMTVKRQDTAELQLLIETLQINPDLITVDVVSKQKEEEEPAAAAAAAPEAEEHSNVSVVKVDASKEPDKSRKRKPEEETPTVDVKIQKNPKVNIQKMILLSNTSRYSSKLAKFSPPKIEISLPVKLKL